MIGLGLTRLARVALLAVVAAGLAGATAKADGEAQVLAPSGTLRVA